MLFEKKANNSFVPHAVGGGIDDGASATEDFSPPRGQPGAAALAASPEDATGQQESTPRSMSTEKHNARLHNQALDDISNDYSVFYQQLADICQKRSLEPSFFGYG